ncbi:MAG: glycosyltransferase family 4 protein [Pseudomonadota bacterium]|nr:glycosyltransferase family 4 protein [Pseudomonadota bacterium]MEE3098531.1 glycosyltransferase family 4 protein [Pseudomonadota bacterium]
MTVHHIMPDHELGGGGVMIARLVGAFRARGDGAGHVVLLPENTEPRQRALFADLPHRFGAFPGRGSLTKMAKAIASGAAKGDVIHAHGSRAAMAAALAGAFRRDLRVVYTVHGFHGLAQPGPLGLRSRIEHLLARRVDATAFVSEADAALARAHGLRHRGPAVVIENGMTIPPAAPEDPRDVDLLFVGRLVYQKWPEAFVETAALVPGAPRVVMVAAGELAETVDARLAELALADVTRHDGLPPEETLALMRRAKLVVMTSRWEGLPTVAIEAIMSGALLTGFDIPPTREILGEAADACLTPAEPAALAPRLTALLDDDAARVALAGPLQARTRARFDAARMADRYAALYAGLPVR